MSQKSSIGTNNTQLQLLGAFRQSFYYCEIAMPINFIESSDARQTAAMSKIYTSGNVSTFEGCFRSSAGKSREVSIGITFKQINKEI